MLQGTPQDRKDQLVDEQQLLWEPNAVRKRSGCRVDFRPEILPVRTGDPMFGSLPPLSKSLEGLTDRFDTDFVDRQAVLERYLSS